jgi:hypothetical protein
MTPVNATAKHKFLRRTSSTCQQMQHARAVTRRSLH